MLFKSLEIQGFKSFADKTVLKFDTRTTAVVGSNGNGKSNISDALRWVMGEQGAKTLRGDKMEDVIFHGTVERKPMGFASVVLTIDNSDRSLAVDCDEVVISRKLYRSGESEYNINGKKSGLRAIQELLMGTGLGRDGYSIIGQGRVDEITKARDTQRREIFEEAAGVSLFLHKKAAAEKDLVKAEENITHQKDLMRADEERLPRLKAQSEKAIQYAELMAERTTLEVSVSVAHLNEKRGDLSAIRDKLLLNEAEVGNFERDIKKAEDEIEEIGDKKLGYQSQIEQLRKDIRSETEERSEKEKAIAVAKNNIENNEKRRRELKEQLENAEKSERDFNDKISQLNNNIKAAQSEAEKHESTAKDLQKQLDEITEKSAREGEEYSALELKITAARSEKVTQEITKSMANDTIESIEKQKSDFLEGIEGSENDLAKYRGEIEAAKKDFDKITEELKAAENKSAGMELLANTKKTRFENAQKASVDTDNQLNVKEQRYRVLLAVEKTREGYKTAVKEVLKAGDQGRFTGIHGTVADVISVPERYVTAMETVLSGVMQNIIVDNDDVAARCIGFLKSSDFGRATFYPLTTIKGRSLNEPRLLSEDGFEGIASSLVEYDKEYEQIISNLLGTTVVVDDLSTAKVMGKKYGYRFRIVTLDGQLVNAGGSFTGGSKEIRGNSVISRKQTLDALSSEISELRKTAKVKKEEFDRYKAEYDKFNIELEGLQDEIDRLERSGNDKTAEISRLDALIKQLESQGESSKQSIKGFDDRINAQKKIISDAESKIKELSGQIAELERARSERSGERSETEKKIGELTEQLNKANDDHVNALHNIELRKLDIKNLEENRSRTLQSSGNYKASMEKLDAEDNASREEIERTEREIKEKSGTVDDKEKQIKELTDNSNKCEQQITELRKSIDAAKNNQSKFSSELARLEERKANIQKEYDRIVSMLFERYKLTVTEAEQQAQIPEDMVAAENDLRELTERINKLGTINPESIDEYKFIFERNEDQKKQLKDIERSKSELEELIRKLTADIEKQFLDSFNDINRHFKDIFTQIFGPGSHAELELTDPENLLSTGIEIKAAPPGKLAKSLNLLSGGERALVAITIYFAILMHRPTPFCMLDEVDAALDDINVEKYIKYVNQFSHKTQLMLISHRRGTIEGCQVLYGVYMQEKGVSRLLLQELTDDLEGVE